MGRPYSMDLRERVLRAVAAGEASLSAIARHYEVSLHAVRCWVARDHSEGHCAPRPHGRGFRSVLDDDDGAVLRALVAERNDATLAEYAAAFAARTGEPVSVSSVCRALQRHGLVLKKRASGRRSKADPTSSPNATSSSTPWPTSTRAAWSSSTRAPS